MTSRTCSCPSVSSKTSLSSGTSRKLEQAKQIFGFSFKVPISASVMGFPQQIQMRLFINSQDFHQRFKPLNMQRAFFFLQVTTRAWEPILQKNVLRTLTPA